MRKDELIKIISAKTGAKQVTVRAILDVFQDVIAESLTVGEKVSLNGFGVFEIKSRSPRIGRNPHTREAVEIPTRVLPSFTPSDAFKARISGQHSAKKPVAKSPRTSPTK